MKFEMNPTGSIEIAGIDKVVENDVVFARDGSKTVKVKVENTTMIWMKHGAPESFRWLQWAWGFAGDMSKVVTGRSPVQMHSRIQHAIMRRDKDVWFHGDTCNIDHILNYNEFYPRKAQYVTFRVRDGDGR